MTAKGGGVRNNPLCPISKLPDLVGLVLEAEEKSGSPTGTEWIFFNPRDELPFEGAVAVVARVLLNMKLSWKPSQNTIKKRSMLRM